jgi:hypothetical protein
MTGEPPGVVQQALLRAEGSCGELESRLQEMAVMEMRVRLAESWQWAAQGSHPPGGSVDAGVSPAPSAGPGSYTQTNTQVAGVDEADIVKNDGRRIFVLSGSTLYLNASWPPKALSTTATAPIEGQPQEMMLIGEDRLAVFSTLHQPRASSSPCAGPGCWWPPATTTKVTVLDVHDLSSPQVVQELYVPGRYTGSRRVGDAVRLVLREPVRWPQGVQWHVGVSSREPEAMRQQYLELLARNEEAIRSSSLSDWLPPLERRSADGTVETLGRDCHAIHLSKASARLGFATVLTLNPVDSSQRPAQTSVVGEVSEIYASKRSLYLASNHWWWQAGFPPYTYLHKFDLSQPDRVEYRASGGVPGTILDQFSMDEDEQGSFRIATTLSGADESGRWQTVNHVRVLAEHKGRLEEVGRTEDLAPGERIFSARFVGERGFVVTFRQVDPLFTLDLSDPRNPRKVGELKVPGFSTYLHPIDRDHLLAIGQDVPENGGWPRRVKLSLFDVSDFANPKEKFTQLVGEAHGFSEALHDHRAFTWFASRSTLAIPFVDYRPWWSSDSTWSTFTSEVRVFRVDPVRGISALGSVPVKDMYERYSTHSWDAYGRWYARRSVVVDRYVYAISSAGIRVAPLEDPERPLKTVEFDAAGL